jgi:hypothetical protein
VHEQRESVTSVSGCIYRRCGLDQSLSIAVVDVSDGYPLPYLHGQRLPRIVTRSGKRDYRRVWR